MTVHEGAHGLNLQDRADAIVVTRPQPGDLVEQMKGRVDRPGQKVRKRNKEEKKERESVCVFSLIFFSGKKIGDEYYCCARYN